MKILKFGGSSVANAENIKKVIQIISDAFKKHRGLIVVVSALGSVTDNLIKISSLASKSDGGYQALMKNLFTQHSHVIKELIKPAEQKKILGKVNEKYQELADTLRGISLLGEISLRTLDKVMSFGEQLSAYIISEATSSQGPACKFVDARTLIKTDSNFGSANVEIQKTYELIFNYSMTNPGPTILGGFIASNHDGITTTLGRGGSDYTASLMGAALNAEVIEIWTDVDGVMTADPRKVETAFPLSKISYEEAGELAHFGAKVIHPKTMKPARLKNIPIDIKNTFNPRGEGTRICNEKSRQAFPIKGISSLGGISLLHIQSNNSEGIGAIATRIFDTISRLDIEILLTTQASHEQALSIAIDKKNAQKAKAAVEKNFVWELKAKQMSPILIEDNLSIVAIVGKQMKGVPGLSGKLFNTLGKNKINVIAIAQGSSELNVSAVINSKDEVKALRAIHKEFFKLDDKSINLFLIGTGLIGSTLLKQINEVRTPVRICGLANNQHMLLNGNGIVMKDWQQNLASGCAINLKDFVSEMIKLDLPNSVFVDCTASEDVVSMYENVLTAGIAIVTPNKKANSGAFVQYQRLKTLSQETRTPFIYDTNIGAGLPIIRTVQNLIASGDQIIKIEAILSGTLSYIFNTFATNDKQFSQIIHEAKRLGYTEPDPRDDLRGTDMARKILILARETGAKLELKHIKINPIIPKKYFEDNSIDEFFTKIKTLDDYFEKKKLLARSGNKVLRYIATLHDGVAKLLLQEIGSNHPFYHLSGSDNIISITTQRYHDTPLVIKGPGAGAEVTAGGILSNILNIFK